MESAEKTTQSEQQSNKHEHMQCFEERLDLLYSLAGTTSTISIASATTVFALFYLQGSSPGLWLWYLCVLAATCARFLQFHSYSHHPARLSKQGWYRLNMITGVFAGAAWGLLPLHDVSGQHVAMLGFELIFPTFLATGAITSYSIFHRQYTAFCLALFPTLIVSYFFMNGTGSAPMFIAFIFVLGGLLSMAKRFENNVLENMLSSAHLQRVNAELSKTNQKLAEHHALQDQEQELAAHVYARLTQVASSPSAKFRSWNEPMGKFSGDLILFADGPRDTYYAMLGDFTGHGLPAALGAVPTANIFQAMAQKGLPVGEIAKELHSKLSDLLPTGYFCCAVILEWLPAHSRLHFWNGGLPSIIVQSKNGELIEYPSDTVPLGVGGRDLYQDVTKTIDLLEHDRVLIFSDGVIEAMAINGKLWGKQNLIDCLKRSMEDEFCLTKMQNELHAFTQDAPPSDDISVIELLNLSPEKIHERSANKAADPPSEKTTLV